MDFIHEQDQLSSITKRILYANNNCCSLFFLIAGILNVVTTITGVFRYFYHFAHTFDFYLNDCFIVLPVILCLCSLTVLWFLIPWISLTFRWLFCLLNSSNMSNHNLPAWQILDQCHLCNWTSCSIKSLTFHLKQNKRKENANLGSVSLALQSESECRYISLYLSLSTPTYKDTHRGNMCQMFSCCFFVHFDDYVSLKIRILLQISKNNRKVIL